MGLDRKLRAIVSTGIDRADSARFRKFTDSALQLSIDIFMDRDSIE